jgi:hypothetical protein
MTTTKTIKSQSLLVKSSTTTTTTTSIHRNNNGKIHRAITNYQTQLYIILLLITILCIYMYAQYQYYYSSSTIAAVNRLIRHEAQRLEQQREQHQYQPQRPTVGEQQNDLSPVTVQQLRLSSSNAMSKISPQQLLLRGTGNRLLPVLPR